MKTLKVDQVVIEPDVQQRASGIDKTYVSELAEVLSDKKKNLPPITVYAVNTMRGPFILAGGHHTLEAYQQAGRQVIPATIVKGTKEDAVVFALSDNATHGKRRTYEDCCKAVRTARAMFPSYSDRKIDDVCGLFPGFTSRFLRKEGEREVDPKKSAAGQKGNEARHGSKDEPTERPEGQAKPSNVDEVPFEVGSKPNEEQAEVPRDRLGRPLPESLHAAFVPGEIHEAHAAARRAYNLSRKFDSRGAETGLRLAVAGLQRRLPYCVCPSCDGAGCDACGGKGYLTYGGFEKLPTLLQEQCRSYVPGDTWEGELPAIPNEVPTFDTEPGCDGKGNKIPKRLRDHFADEYLAEAATIVQGIGSGIVAASAWNPWLLSEIGERLRNTAAEIAGSRPFAVCDACKGKGCEVCQTSGFRPVSHQHELS